MAKKLSQKALDKLFRRHEIKEAIASELGLAEENGFRTVRSWISKNKPNGKLTCDAVVKLLCRELKLTRGELLINCKNEGPVKQIRKGSRAAISTG
jgi:hypothetical protein